MARSNTPDYQECVGLDCVEAWLFRHLGGEENQKFDQYPAWAMMEKSSGQAKAPIPFTRFWATAGCLEFEREGVRFVPPEVLQVSASDLQSFWATIQPVLDQHGWQRITPAGVHTLLRNPVPVPMEQASPWSVQGIVLTDYLPMNQACSAWRRMWLDMQVELHNAQFNAARDAKGLKPLNALWFWGGGEPWQARLNVPRVKSVSADGLFDAVKMTDLNDGLLNRFVFWTQLLTQLPQSASKEDNLEQRAGTVYCVSFEGWGNNAKVFSVLEEEVLQPMRLAGLSFNWVLLGEQGWKTLKSNWMNRFKFWKNKPDWAVLAEPEPLNMPSEADLQAAWEQGQQDQNDIQAQWKVR